MESVERRYGELRGVRGAVSGGSTLAMILRKSSPDLSLIGGTYPLSPIKMVSTSRCYLTRVSTGQHARKCDDRGSGVRDSKGTFEGRE